MRFDVVVNGELSKTVGVGVFEDQQLAFSATGDNGGGLFGVGNWIIDFVIGRTTKIITQDLALPSGKRPAPSL